MRFFFALAVSLATVIPTQMAFAADAFDFLLRDLTEFEDVMEDDRDTSDDLSEELDFESSLELFPGDADEAQEAEDGEGEQQPLDGDYAYVLHNGSKVLLEDVPVDQWFAEYVQDTADLGIIGGYADASGAPLGLFGPADNVTVEQLAKIAVESAQVDQSKCPEVPVNSLAADSWSAGYIACAEHLGWTVYSDGTVNISRNANRAEVVQTILQAFAREMEPATGEVFQDVTSTMPTRYAIETAAEDGIVSGYTDENGPTGFFGPFDSITRAATAKIVSLALKTYTVQ